MVDVEVVCELTTQPILVARLFIKEEEVVPLLRAICVTEKSFAPDIIPYLRSFAHRERELPFSHTILLSDEANDEYQEELLEKLVGNPIHVYSLIWRWGNILPHIVVGYTGQFKSALENLVNSVDTITEPQLDSVTQALLRVQFAYRLDPVHMARGNIMGIQTQANLDVLQMMDIARRCSNGEQRIRPGIHREFATAIEWLEAALKINNDSALKIDLEFALDEVIEMHDKFWFPQTEQRGVFPNEEFFHQPLSLHNKTGGQLRQEESQFLLDNPVPPHESVYYHLQDLMSLCRGEETSVKITFKPLCLLDNRGAPYLYLSPLHVEQLSLDPPVIQIHDLLTDNQIKHMKSLTEMDLKTAATMVTPTEQKVGNERTQSHAWIWDDDPDMNHISRSLSLMTGLQVHSSPILHIHTSDLKTEEELIESGESLTRHVLQGIKANTGVSLPQEEVASVIRNDDGVYIRLWREGHGTPWANFVKEYQAVELVESEAWQIGVYSSGGHYLPHEDYFRDPLPDFVGPRGDHVGNRIATIMFYLSDVQAGGRTVFPKLGVGAKPRKGSALFWYNLDHRGDGLKTSLHSACPTALGIKWVSNKWVREGAQIFHRPCLPVD